MAQTPQVEVETPTKIGTSLKVLAGIAILAGLGFAAYAAAPFGKVINFEPIGPRPFLVKDVTDAIATSLWSTDSASLYYDNSDQFYRLGDLPHGSPGTYIDGESGQTDKPLVVGTLTPQKARVIAVQTFDPVMDTSLLRMVCIPADNSPFSRKNYYIDTSGSAYSSKALSAPALTNCSQMAAKSYFPTSITSATLSEPLPTFHVNLGLHKDKYLLGYYNVDHTFFLTGNQGMGGSKAPFWINVSATDETFTLPQRTLQLRTNLGVATLCIPETAVAPHGGQKEYYYDNAGQPYSDPLLTQQVPCGVS